MKVIDLLNKIANNEEVPRVRYDDIEAYIGADGYLKDNYGDNVEWWIDKEWLNTEIEIIEEKPISLKPFKNYLEDTSDLPQIDKDNRIIEYIHQMSLKINYLLEKESDK